MSSEPPESSQQPRGSGSSDQLPNAWGRTPEETGGLAARGVDFPRPRRSAVENEGGEELVVAKAPFPWMAAGVVVALAAGVGVWAGTRGGGEGTGVVAAGGGPELVEETGAAVPVVPVVPVNDPAAMVYVQPGGEGAVVSGEAAAVEEKPEVKEEARVPEVAVVEDVPFRKEDAGIFEMEDAEEVKPEDKEPEVVEPKKTTSVEGKPKVEVAEVAEEDGEKVVEVELTALDRQYVAALEREAAKAGDKGPWLEEVKRVKTDDLLNVDVAALPAVLQKMRGIYMEKRGAAAAGGGEAGAAVAGDRSGARTFEMHVLADDGVTVYLNGEEMSGTYLVGGKRTPGAIIKFAVTAAPGDVLGFQVKNEEGQAYFAATASSGVQWLFGSSARWESMAGEAEMAWLKGEGKTGGWSREMRPGIDYAGGVAELFEKRAGVRSTAYRIIWPGGNAAAFRYKLRPNDLPKKANPTR
jgi:hypothetical protein